MMYVCMYMINQSIREILQEAVRGTTKSFDQPTYACFHSKIDPREF